MQSMLHHYDVILLAEDIEDHIMLTRRAFKMAGLLNPVVVVRDGEEAIAYLTGEGKFANRFEYPLPTLLLLDLKMPRKNGFEVLEWLRGKTELSALRVVVLTTSDRIQDVNRAYQLGANSFLTKPVDFRDFVQLSAAIKGYWLWMSRAPEVERPDTKNSVPR
jgi:CheY-like chemotaxis protein